MISEMLNNLGIYNDKEENEGTLNKHIEQGNTFRNYNDTYLNAKENDHSLLSKSFFPDVSEPFEGGLEAPSSIEGYLSLREQARARERASRREDDDKDEDELDAKFNTLLEDYRLLYNTYKSDLAAGKKPSTAMSAQLASKYADLITEAQILMNYINSKKENLFKHNIKYNYKELKREILSLKHHHEAIMRINNDTVKNQRIADTLNGKLETTSLKMTSNYYFYIVYFLVSVTIIGMTFNLLVNPAADVIKSVYVVGGILTIYIVSKYIVN
jgi:hypothetical protein